MIHPVAQLLFAVSVASAATGQGRYSFAEREPSTRVEKAISKLLPSVVKVHGASGLKTITSYATGIVVSDRGHILTLDMVLVQPGQTKVVLHDGTVLDVDVLPPDLKYGVRMLKIREADIEKLETPLIPVEVAQKQDHRNGTFVLSMGNCFRLAEFSEKVSATFGVIVARLRSGLRFRLQEVDYGGELIVTDAANNPGHYGGGLFTIDGQWIGMNTKVVESTETNTQVSAAIPTGVLSSYIERCLAGKALSPTIVEETHIVPVFHGITLFDQGRRVSPPAYVERVRRGSPGRRAGLRPDDLIVRLGEHTVRTCAEFRTHLENYKPGDKVVVTFKRGTEVKQVELELEAVKG